MSASQPNSDLHSVELELRVDEVCSDFEGACQGGQRPRIDDYLPRVPAEVRDILLRELVALEIHYRPRDPDSLWIDEYVRRFPELHRAWLASLARADSSIKDAARCSASDAPGSAPTQVMEDTATADRSQEELPQLRDYELLAEIARGGMGIVYRAWQKSVKRLVAVKMLRSGIMGSEKERQRFRLEAEATAALDHPHIVPIYDVGEDRGHRFFVMKLIEGGTLARRLPEFALPASPTTAAEAMARQVRIARLLATVARTVHYAHQRGILHRDLKPSNILLDSAAEPHVADFGLARQVTGPPSLTETGVLLGTPCYMAPEAISGGAKNVSTAVDIYALGVILYELLAGEVPFQAPASIEVLYKVLNEEPVPPRKSRPGVARDLEIICQKCMQKEPQSRYASAEELAADLERFARGEPILARPSTSWERSWRWCRRNPRQAILLAVAIISLLTVAVGSFSASLIFQKQRDALQAQQREIKDANREAQEKLAESYLDQARANRLSGQVGHRFDTLSTLEKAVELARTLDLPKSFFDQLRSEAIATMSLPDIRLAKELTVTSDEVWVARLDARFERLACLEVSGRVHVWNVTDETVLCRIPGSGYSMDLAISPDGRYVSTIDAQGRWRLWRVEHDEAVDQLEWKVDVIARNAEFSPDSRLVAVCLRDGTVALYNLTARSEIRRLSPAGQPGNVAFHPSQPRIAVGHGKTVSIFDLESSELVLELPQPGSVFSVAWHPDGTHLAVSSNEDQHVHIWNLAENKIVQSLPNLPFGTTMAFHPAGELVATTGYDLVTRLWNWRRGEKILQIAQPATQFSADGRYLGPHQRNNQVGLWEVHSAPEHRALVRELAMGQGDYSFPAVSPDNRLLFVALLGDRVHTERGGISIWDLRNGRELGFLEGFGSGGGGLATDATGAMIVSREDSVYRAPVWREDSALDSVHFGPLQKTPLPPGRLAASRDGKFLASAAQGAVVWYREPENRVLPISDPTIGWVTGTSDGRWVVTGGTAAIAWRKEGDSFVRDRELITNRNLVRVLMSPDDKWLATVERSSDVFKLWRVGDWDEGHPPGEGGFGGAFSPDGKYFAIGTAKCAVRLLEVESGREVVHMEEYLHDRPGYIEYSRDGAQLVVVSGIGRRVHVWDLRVIGKQLEKLGLGWELPAFPEPAPEPPRPIRLMIDLGATAQVPTPH